VAPSARKFLAVGCELLDEITKQAIAWIYPYLTAIYPAASRGPAGHAGHEIIRIFSGRGEGKKEGAVGSEKSKRRISSILSAIS
jgi:hypothetical protein